MPVLIAVLVALLWVFALRRWYRQAPSPLESVEHQQRALDALQHAASRARTGPTASDGSAIRSAPTAALPGGHPQRSWTPLVVAAAGTFLLVGVGVIWWVGRTTTNNQSAISATSPTSRARRSTSTTTTTAPPTTTTTLAPFARATVTAQSSSSVTFAVDRPTFTVTIAATAPCWVRATAPGSSVTPNATAGPTSSTASSSSSSQQTVFEKTMQAGDSQPIPANGALQVRLGAVNNVTIALDGQPLALPIQARSTLDLTFNGSSNGA